MRRSIGVATIVSYNLKTKEVQTKEFVESAEVDNPIGEAEALIDKRLRHQLREDDNWHHKVYYNKRADQIRKKIWSNLD